MGKWIHSSVSLLEPLDAKSLIKKVELACRNCYKSEDKIGEGTAEKLILNCLSRGHESVLEHSSVSYRVICDRGVSHEWVRHRNTAYSQESTRYCNYSKDKFGNQLTFIYPAFYSKLDGSNTKELAQWDIMQQQAEDAEKAYFKMLKEGATPEIARAILPNCLKTELIVTMNIRELRHFIRLRTTAAAHPDIRILAKELLNLLRQNGLSVFFEDFNA